MHRVFRLVASLALLSACGDGVEGPSLHLVDFHRHARFTADGGTIVHYHHDERPGIPVGIFRVDRASGDEAAVVEAILAGLDVHPATDSIVFSARAGGEAEPALWLIHPDGTGFRRVLGDGIAVGHRWPAFSADGSRLAWEVRRMDQTGLDTARTLWTGGWDRGAVTNARPIAPGRRPAWRPDGAALAVEQRRPGDARPRLIVLMDTSGVVLDTLGFGTEPVWRPDGTEVAYHADRQEPDRGCTGVCFVSGDGAPPRSLSTTFHSFPGGWTHDGTSYVFGRLMRTYSTDVGGIQATIEESRLWIRTLATGEDRQITF